MQDSTATAEREIASTGTPIETADGVRTIVTSEYLAGYCVRPDGSHCHPDAILVRIRPLDSRLDRIVRPDGQLPPIQVAPPKLPVAKPEKPKKKKPKKKTEEERVREARKMAEIRG